MKRLAIIAALAATPATSATVSFDSAGSFFAVAADTYTGGKVALPPVTSALTAGAEIDMELLALIAFVALMVARWDNDAPHIDCRCGFAEPLPPAPVPLPAGLPLMLAGLGVFALARGMKL